MEVDAVTPIIDLRRSYGVDARVVGLYTGGPVCVGHKKNFVLLPCNTDVKMVGLTTGEEITTVHGDDSDVIGMALAPDEDLFLLISRSQMMKLCRLATQEVVRAWRGHDVPAAHATFNPSSTHVAIASADRVVKVWDAVGGFVATSFTVSGPPTSVAYCTLPPRAAGDEPPKKKRKKGAATTSAAPQASTGPVDVVVVGDQMGSVTVFDCVRKTVVHHLKLHFSHVTFVGVTADHCLVTAGRDKTVLVHKVSLDALDKLHGWTMGEELAAGTLLEAEGRSAWVALCGTSGTPRVYDVHTKQRLTAEGATSYPQTMIHCHPTTNGLVIATEQQSLLMFALTQPDATTVELDLTCTLSGFNDAVGDAFWVDQGATRFAAAMNSNLVRVYRKGSAFCDELQSHGDLVTCLSVSSDYRWLASGSKDTTVRIWSLSNPKYPVVTVLDRHPAHVVGVDFSPLQVDSSGNCTSSSFHVVSVDSDGIAKVWDVAHLLRKKKRKQQAQQGVELISSAAATIKAHEKAANCVAVAASNTLVATGGRDKKLNLWTLEGHTLSLHVSIAAHRRGVNCVRFSPVDRLVASGSGDKLIKLWKVADGTCVRTLQGHEDTVCCLAFLNQGLQMASTDAEGKLKLWVLKTGECLNTFSEHSEEEGHTAVWALDAARDGSSLLTGGMDSVINVWRDYTAEEAAEDLQERQETTVQTQQLKNLMREGQWGDAIRLALDLRRKHDLQVVTAHFMHTVGTTEGLVQLKEVLRDISDDALETLLGFCKEWNANAKVCPTAQWYLQCIFRTRRAEELASSEKLREVVEALGSYNKRHLNRVQNQLQQTFLLDNLMHDLNPVGA